MPSRINSNNNNYRNSNSGNRSNGSNRNYQNNDGSSLSHSAVHKPVPGKDGKGGNGN